MKGAALLFSSALVIRTPSIQMEGEGFNYFGMRGVFLVARHTKPENLKQIYVAPPTLPLGPSTRRPWFLTLNFF